MTQRIVFMMFALITVQHQYVVYGAITSNFIELFKIYFFEYGLICWACCWNKAVAAFLIICLEYLNIYIINANVSLFCFFIFST